MKARRGARVRPSPAASIEDQVRKLAAMAASQEEIAEFTGIALRTLQREIAKKASPVGRAYRAGLDERKESLLRMMWTAARGGSVVAQIWLSKNLLGWKDRAEVDHRGILKRLGQFSDEELLQASLSESPGEGDGTAG